MYQKDKKSQITYVSLCNCAPFLLFQERAGDLEELVAAELGRLREFLQEEEERIKEKLQKQKEGKLKQLEEALTQTTEQISRLENTAEQLRLKLREEENPEQLKVRERQGEGECAGVVRVEHGNKTEYNLIITVLRQYRLHVTVRYIH